MVQLSEATTRATDEMMRQRQRIFDAMQEERDKQQNVVAYTQGSHNAVRQAITMLLLEMHGINEANRQIRAKLEARIADLEEQATRP